MSGGHTKWLRGQQIKDPALAAILILGEQVIFERDKAQNAGWTQNWSLATIRALVSRGQLYTAVPNQTGETE